MVTLQLLSSLTFQLHLTANFYSSTDGSNTSLDISTDATAYIQTDTSASNSAHTSTNCGPAGIDTPPGWSNHKWTLQV